MIVPLFITIALSSLSSASPIAEKRLIALSESEQKWMTMDQIYSLYSNAKEGERVNFFDMTDFQDAIPISSFAAPTSFPTKLTQQTLVKDLSAKIDPVYMDTFLKKFSSFNNRFFQSETGVQSAEFLVTELNGIKASTARKDVVVTVEKFQHSFKQFSVIARLEAATPNLKDVIILGCHQDSINQQDPLNGAAPGVDDDGTGVVNNLQVLKLLVGEPSFVPSRPIEFHFYAGEEMGLLGSSDIAKSYAAKNVDVFGMLQTDMTGFKPSKDIAIYTDNVNPKLTDTLTLIAKEYTSLNVVSSTCEFACSDHVPWTKLGFPTCLHAEAKIEEMNPFVHGLEDIFDKISYDHIGEFVKNSLGFAIEMSKFVDPATAPAKAPATPAQVPITPEKAPVATEAPDTPAQVPTKVPATPKTNEPATKQPDTKAPAEAPTPETPVTPPVDTDAEARSPTVPEPVVKNQPKATGEQAVTPPPTEAITPVTPSVVTEPEIVPGTSSVDAPKLTNLIITNKAFVSVNNVASYIGFLITISIL